MKRWKIWIGVLVIFLSGMLIGAIGSGIYIKHRVGLVMKGERGHVFHKLFIKRISDKLDLNEEERKDMERIVNQAADALLRLHLETREKAHAILDRSVSQMKEHLPGEKQKKLDEFVEHMKSRRPRFFKRALSRRKPVEQEKTLEKVISEVKSQLNLTEQHLSQIRPILKKSVAEKQALIQKYHRQDREARRSFREEKLKIDRHTENRLELILTEEQMRKYREFREERLRGRLERMMEHGNRRLGP